MTNAASDTRRPVVLCDRDGNSVGSADLLEVHRGEGVLHKAFSVFVFGAQGSDLLLQQRSRFKELFPLRWANTCCSHPSPTDRSLADAAERRLREELGFSVSLREAGAFVYRAKDPAHDLSEYEHDTVLVGSADADVAVNPDPAEIAAWRWFPLAGLGRDMQENGERYAPWLAKALPIALAELRNGR